MLFVNVACAIRFGSLLCDSGGGVGVFEIDGAQVECFIAQYPGGDFAVFLGRIGEGLRGDK